MVSPNGVSDYARQVRGEGSGVAAPQPSGPLTGWQAIALSGDQQIHRIRMRHARRGCPRVAGGMPPRYVPPVNDERNV